jgi:hypothetical protein
MCVTRDEESGSVRKNSAPGDAIVDAVVEVE